MEKKDIVKELEKNTQKVNQKDVDKVLKNEAKITGKAQKGPLAKFFMDIKLMFSLLKDYFNGYYKVGWGTIAVIVGTLIYVLSPIDLIPDFIPVAGLTDDAAVVSLAIKMLYDELELYKKFKQK